MQFCVCLALVVHMRMHTSTHGGAALSWRCGFRRVLRHRDACVRDQRPPRDDYVRLTYFLPPDMATTRSEVLTKLQFV